MANSCCDVVILGAGPAGCATAIALARRGVRSVLVLEAGDVAQLRSGESLPPDSRPLFERLGIWTEFLATRPDPCPGTASSWGAASLGYNDFIFNPHGPGWHVDRCLLDRFLVDRALASGARLRTRVRVRHIAREPTQTTLTVSAADHSSETISTRFVVDATGSRSWFARAMGARQLLNDRLVCIAGFFGGGGPADHSRITLLEAVEYGWWYSARLPSGQRTLVLATDVDIAHERGLRQPAIWNEHLRATRHMISALGDARPDGRTLTVRSAPSFVLDRAAGRGWLAVGDAASAFDPISSQGLYKALVTGLEAAARIATALSTDSEASLELYHALVAARFAEYRRVQSHFYAIEQRWGSAPFWRRRQPPVSVSLPTRHAPDVRTHP